MNILIIDDQVNVVNGTVSGIEWDKTSITSIFKAYNAHEARKIIQTENIDIILCDIEMPEETGLQLFAWIKEEEYSIECIFLTAHADFSFAREAIKLGGFDYILQPARYEEVQEAIIKAEQKIIIKNKMNKYSTYGKKLYNKRSMIIEEIVKRLFTEEEYILEDLIKDLKEFNVNLDNTYLVCPVLIHMIRKTIENITFEQNLLSYVFQNIIEELFEDLDYNVLVVHVHEENYVLLVSAKKDQGIDSEKIQSIMNKFIEITKELFGYILASYVGNSVGSMELREQMNMLLEFKKDNVTLVSKVVSIKSSRILKIEEDRKEPMKHWDQALIGGKADWVKEEAYKYLDNINLNAQMLKRFYYDFMQVLARAEEEIGISKYQVFNEKKELGKSLIAYKSVSSMKELIDYVVQYFTSATKKDEINYVELAIQYINGNIEKDIRRQDIAEVVSLNEDYLSRIFKKEQGISLKQFITLEKMKQAQNLLKITNLSVGAIAMKVGFENFSHFSQMYKKTMGVTPIEERETLDIFD